MKIREVVKWFSGKMEEKLMQNDHKGGWANCSIEDLYKRLLDEVRELQSEINFPTRDYEAIIKECADSSNFSMMIADLARKKLEESRDNKE